MDLTDEAAIIALGKRLGTFGHVVSTASARGRIADLDRDAVRVSFDTKVIGPFMLAKHLGPRIASDDARPSALASGNAAVRWATQQRRNHARHPR